MPKKLPVVANSSPIIALSAAFQAMKAKGIFLDDRLLKEVVAAARSKGPHQFRYLCPRRLDDALGL